MIFTIIIHFMSRKFEFDVLTITTFPEVLSLSSSPSYERCSCTYRKSSSECDRVILTKLESTSNYSQVLSNLVLMRSIPSDYLKMLMYLTYFGRTLRALTLKKVYLPSRFRKIILGEVFSSEQVKVRGMVRGWTRRLVIGVNGTADSSRLLMFPLQIYLNSQRK